MVLNIKTRLVLAGAVLGASLFTLMVANAQIDPSTGAPVTPGIPETPPGASPSPGVSSSPGTVPNTQPSPSDTGLDAGIGGSGSIPTYPSPLNTDAGMGGSGLMPPPVLGGLDAGLR